jgi:hypothetical protein
MEVCGLCRWTDDELKGSSGLLSISPLEECQGEERDQ